jgi:hypothetical protein
MLSKGVGTMEDSSRNDIRRLLKAFGIQADEVISAHLDQNPDIGILKVRLVLEDVTDYREQPPEQSLQLEIEGEIRG